MTGRRPKLSLAWLALEAAGRKANAPKSQAVAFSPGSAEGKSIDDFRAHIRASALQIIDEA
jgi:hypothetical protein